MRFFAAVTIWCVTSIAVTPIAASALTGTDWRTASEDIQNGYVAGVLDAWNRVYILSGFARQRSAAYQPSEVEATYGAVGQCINERQIPYKTSIDGVRRFLDEHPQEKSNDMAVVIYRAMSELCHVAAGR